MYAQIISSCRFLFESPASRMFRIDEFSVLRCSIHTPMLGMSADIHSQYWNKKVSFADGHFEF